MPPVVPTSLAVPRAVSPETPAVLMDYVSGVLARHNHFQLDLGGAWLPKVYQAYRQPHRFFHNLGHLASICRLIEADAPQATPIRTAQLLLTALFHDVVWYPQRNDNEEQSAIAFDLLRHAMGGNLPDKEAREVRSAILSTKRQAPSNQMAHRFHEYDCDILMHGSAVDLLAYEFQIFREFQFLSLLDYRKGRISFFQRFARRFPQCAQTMAFLIEYLERRRPRIGIYAGTFNPLHIGHASILQKAELMFDKVILAVGLNPQKNAHHKGDDGPVRQIRKVLPFHEVIFFDTLMVDLLEGISRHADATLVRGLRNGYDLDYEMSQQCFMQEMLPETHSVYIPCDKQLEHISSSALRGLRLFQTNGRDERYYPHTYDYFFQTTQEQFGE